jgi:hypothetical protein
LAGPLDIGAGLAGLWVANSSQALDSMVGVVKRLCYNGHAEDVPLQWDSIQPQALSHHKRH